MKSVDIYSAIYKSVNRNMTAAGEELPFSENELLFFTESNPAEADLDALREIHDNRQFADAAYIALLNKRIDAESRLVWENRLGFPEKFFQDCVINSIIYSPEFKNANVTLTGKMPTVKKGFVDALIKVKRKAADIKQRVSSYGDIALTKQLTAMTKKAFGKKTNRNKLLTCDLFIERDTAPQDGFELFKYVYAQKNKAVDPYYVMNVHNEQYKEFKAQYGDHIIGYDDDKRSSSSKRIIKYLETTKFICDGYKVFNALRMGVNEAIMKCEDAYLIFVQHGVNFFKDNFITMNSYSAFVFDKLMISNEIEKELFIQRGGFMEDDFIENGLFRWDLLSSGKPEKVNKSIFIYFTHRRYLKSLIDVKSSVYVKTIVSLLTHPKFSELVEKNGFKVKIGVHHSVVDACGSDIFGNFEIIDDIDIAEAKANADILITDYSSMCFEMWFQHKPVIFMNIPDRDDCLKYHHRTDLAEPYKNKEQYLFNLVDTADECVDLLDNYIHNDFSFSEEEKAKRDAFFYYNSGFCERFYNYLLTIKDVKKPLYRIEYNQPYQFSRFADIYTEGVDTPRSTGRWIIAKKAKVGFHVPKSNSELAVKLTVRPLIKLMQYSVGAVIYVNGHKAADFRFTDNKKKDLFLSVPQEWVDSSGYIEISFDISDAVRYGKLTDTRDKRYVSIHLVSLMVFERDGFYTIGNQYTNIVKMIQEKKMLELLEKEEAEGELEVVDEDDD